MATKKENAKKQTVRKKTKASATKKQTRRTEKSTNKTPIKIIPIGGVGEIGKNCYLYEYEDDIVIVDCGMTFPDEETPGMDIVIPDYWCNSLFIKEFQHSNLCNEINLGTY